MASIVTEVSTRFDGAQRFVCATSIILFKGDVQAKSVDKNNDNNTRSENVNVLEMNGTFQNVKCQRGQVVEVSVTGVGVGGVV